MLRTKSDFGQKQHGTNLKELGVPRKHFRNIRSMSMEYDKSKCPESRICPSWYSNRVFWQKSTEKSD